MKKLKRLPNGLSYTEVRDRQDDRERAEREALSPAHVTSDEPMKGQSGEPVASNARAPKTSGKAATVVPAPVEPEPQSSDVIVPSMPEEAGKAPDTPGGGAGKSDDASAQKGQADDEDRPDAPPPSPRPAERSAKTVLLQGYVAWPAYGVCKTYDTVAKSYGDKVAMSHLLDESVRALADGPASDKTYSLQSEPLYSALPKKVQVKRALSRPIYDAIVQDLDPMKIMKPGRVGTIIIQEAVNRFIQSEQAQKE